MEFNGSAVQKMQRGEVAVNKVIKAVEACSDSVLNSPSKWQDRDREMGFGVTTEKTLRI